MQRFDLLVERIFNRLVRLNEENSKSNKLKSDEISDDYEFTEEEANFDSIPDDYEFTDEEANINQYESKNDSEHLNKEDLSIPFSYLFLEKEENLDDYENYLKKILYAFYFPKEFNNGILRPILDSNDLKILQNISPKELMKQVIKRYNVINVMINSDYMNKFFKSAGVAPNSDALIGDDFYNEIYAHKAKNDWDMNAEKFKKLNAVAKILYLFYLVNLFKNHIAKSNDEKKWGSLVSEWELSLYPNKFLASFSLPNWLYKGLNKLNFYDD
jgi:hypothetical protein